MKTEDLIRALSEDKCPEAGAGLRLALALPLAVAATGAVFWALMNLRAGLDQFDVLRAVLIKEAVTLPMAIAGVVLAWFALQPGRARMPLGLLMLPLVTLALALMWDISRFGLDHLSARLFGRNYLACLIAIPLFSLLPLAAMLWAFRRGAPLVPEKAGLLAGLGAAGLGASLYALHCTDDSPFFILAWYSIAALLMAQLGRIAGRRLLAW